MKTFKNTLYILAAIATLPVAAYAQVPGQADFRTSVGVLSSDYSNNPNAERGKHWWRALQEEVNLPRTADYKEVKASDLQHIIFFASVHNEKVDFRASVPQLLDVYGNHSDERMRLMALAALHAIGNEHGMEGLRDAVNEEESEHLRRLTFRALRDFETRQLAAN